MKNIDKVRQMTPEELISFMNSDKCERCTYNGTTCLKEFCTKGTKEWLEQETITIEDIFNEFKIYCDNMKQLSGGICDYCYYSKESRRYMDKCLLDYTIKRFNVVDGKITIR